MEFGIRHDTLFLSNKYSPFEKAGCHGWEKKGLDLGNASLKGLSRKRNVDGLMDNEAVHVLQLTVSIADSRSL